jgi:hypothetical protein
MVLVNLLLVLMHACVGVFDCVAVFGVCNNEWNIVFLYCRYIFVLVVHFVLIYYCILDLVVEHGWWDGKKQTVLFNINLLLSINIKINGTSFLCITMTKYYYYYCYLLLFFYFHLLLIIFLFFHHGIVVSICSFFISNSIYFSISQHRQLFVLLN